MVLGLTFEVVVEKIQSHVQEAGFALFAKANPWRSDVVARWELELLIAVATLVMGMLE